MQTPSLGRRVVLGGVSAVAVLALGLDVLVYLSLRANLNASLEHELDGVARIAGEPGSRDELRVRLAQAQAAVTVRTSAGATTWIGDVALASEPLATRSVVLPDGTPAEVATSRAAADRAMSRLVVVELLATPLVVTLALLVLRLVADYALAPLDRITAAARRTAGGRRGERLRPEPADTRLGQMAAAYDDMLDELEAAVADAERAKGESEQLLERQQAIIETAREALVAVDLDGRIVEWNAEAERTFGWSRDEALGRPAKGTIMPAGNGLAGGPPEPFLTGASTSHADRIVAFTGLRHDGTTFAARMVAWTTTHDGTSTLSAFVWDFTEKMQAAEAAARLAAIVESADQAMLSTTLDGTILTWNASAEQMYGYGADEAIGAHLQLVVPCEEDETVGRWLDAVGHGESIRGAQSRRRRKDGTFVDVVSILSPVLEPDGTVSAASSIDRDVTDERRLAGQLEGTLAALADAAHEARRSEADTRRFLDDAAHQLRAPITNVQACAEALLRGRDRLDPADADELLGALVRETSRAGRLIAGLLRMARLYHGAALDPAPCDLLALCQEECRRAGSRRPHLEVRVAADGPAEVGRPALDAAAVSEIVANLLDNATRHAATRIDVELRRTPDHVVVEVRDDGLGLPASQAESAFERFVSLDGRGGSGLGLPIARELARAHGGDLRYEDGAFVVLLPAPAGG